MTAGLRDNGTRTRELTPRTVMAHELIVTIKLDLVDKTIEHMHSIARHALDHTQERVALKTARAAKEKERAKAGEKERKDPRMRRDSIDKQCTLRLALERTRS